MQSTTHDTATNQPTPPIGATVFDFLGNKILQGNIRGGERLIEAEIAAQFHISRTPVREAFRRLAHEGMVQYRVATGSL